MAVGEVLDLTEQIQSLVADRLQVVSYKWLSRNFSVASDDAKRMLQNFVKEHGSDLEVVYVLSGWLEDDSTYHVKLVSANNLSDAKRKFRDNCSVQVYSIQACTPKDPAVLWNAEFAQAEELFDQPASIQNCLRDNRFCAIINSSVRRNIDSATVSKNDVGTSKAFNPNFSAQSHQDSPPKKISSSALKTSTDMHIEGSTTTDEPSKPNFGKQNDKTLASCKLRAQNEKHQGNGGSLATLWACASTKQNQPNPMTDFVNNALTSTSVAGVNKTSAHDSLVGCADTEQNCGSGRKRKVVFDFSDEETENEDTVSLASPEPSIRDSVIHHKKECHGALLENKTSSSNSQVSIKQENKQEKIKGSMVGLSDALISGDTSMINSAPMLEKGEAVDPVKRPEHEGKAVDNVKPAMPKRKKVLKTRIDARGREVTEVAWEEADVETLTADKATSTCSNVADIRHSAVNQTNLPITSAPNQVGKLGNKKNGKGGKDAKQGNIMSFFKKI